MGKLVNDILNDRQEMFCKEYVVDFNGTQAAIRAGYSKNTANEQAAQNLTKLSIQARIKELIHERSEEVGITGKRIIDEFAKIAFSSIAHLHNTWISLKEFNDLTEDEKASIESIKTRTRTIKENDGDVEIEEIQIKLYDKQRALENLGKYIGIYKEDNEQKRDSEHFTDGQLIDKLTEFADIISKRKK